MKLLLILLLLTPAMGAPQDPDQKPSLAELARKEKARKQALAKKAPLITNADLERFQGARVTTSAGRPAEFVHISPAPVKGETESQAPATEATEPTEKDIEFWKSAFAEARLNLKNAVNRGLVLQLKMNNLRNAFLSEDDGSTQALIQAQLQQTLQEIERNKLETQEAKTVMEKLQSEARKSGVPPKLIDELTGELPEAEQITTPFNPVP